MGVRLTVIQGQILLNAVENLSKVRNSVLDQVVMLSLNGEMNGVQDLFQKEQVAVNYYTLNDFDRVEDENVSTAPIYSQYKTFRTRVIATAQFTEDHRLIIKRLLFLQCKTSCYFDRD